jgi:hypothetical protein
MIPFNYEEFLGKSVEPVFNPPSCPAGRVGKPINLSAVPAELMAGSVEVIEDSAAKALENSDRAAVWMVFGQREDDDNLGDYVETDWIKIEDDDPLSPIVNELADKHDDPRIEHIRQTFCRRTLECRGPVNGECWALGKRAVDQVLRETLL